MTKFLYVGAMPHMSTIEVGEPGKKTQQDLILHPGDEKELDEKHPVVAGLVKRKLLVTPEKK